MKSFFTALLAYVLIICFVAAPVLANNTGNGKKRLSNLSIRQRYEMKQRHKQFRSTFGNGQSHRKTAK